MKTRDQAFSLGKSVQFLGVGGTLLIYTSLGSLALCSSVLHVLMQGRTFGSLSSNLLARRMWDATFKVVAIC